MSSVSRTESFRYGFLVFSYWLVVLVVSTALVAAGGWIIRDQVASLGSIGANQAGALAVLGGFLAFVGVLVFGAGQVGLVYKLVADGVGSGLRASGRPPAGSGADERSESGPADDEETVDRTGSTSAVAASSGDAAATDRDTPPTDSGSGTDPEGADRSTEPRPAAGSDATTREDAPGGQSSAPGGQSSAPGGPSGTGDDEPTDGQSATDPAGGQGGGPASTDRGAGSDDSGPDGQTDTTAEQSPGSGPSQSPTDVASDSEIAEELGFEEGDASDARAGGQSGDRSHDATPGDASRDGPGAEPGGEETDASADPLAPDSDFEPRDGADEAGASDGVDPATAETPIGDAPSSGRADESGEGAGSTASSEPEGASGNDAEAVDDPFVGAESIESASDEGDSEPADRSGGATAGDQTDGETPDWTTGEGHMGPDSADEE